MENRPPQESASPFAGLAKKIRPQGSASAEQAANQSPRLRLIRAHDEGPSCVVRVDGVMIATLESSDKHTVETIPGHHTIHVEARGCGAAAAFEAVKGETVRFQIAFEAAGAGMKGKGRLLGFLLRPTSKITLRRLD